MRLITSGERVDRAEIDQKELASTEIGRRTAVVMTWFFIAMLAVVPISQAGLEFSQGQAPQALKLFAPVSNAWIALWQGGLRKASAAFHPILTRQFLVSFQDDLEQKSGLKNFFQPRVQGILSGPLGYGNHQVVLGRGGWLFYQPGLNYATGPDITSKGTIQNTVRELSIQGGDHAPNPDARPALLELNRDLKEAGIRLIVMPVPDKAVMEPARLTSRLDRSTPVSAFENRGFARLVSGLRAQGVEVFDCSPAETSANDTRYLEQDTHWTPQFMEQTARALAQRIQLMAVLPKPADQGSMRLQQQRVTNLGDLVRMLKLKPDQSIFAPQTATIHQVVDAASGQPWKPDHLADLLLMGDSFVNIYSQPSLGWGRAAGFAEHLSYALDRPLDVIALDGGGSSSTRVELARRDNIERLAAKRIVIFEFAERDLLGQDWLPAPLPIADLMAAVRNRPEATIPKLTAPAAESAVGRTVPHKPGYTARNEELIVTARIVKTSQVPAPETAPYDDCLTYLKLSIERIESGHYDKREIIVVFVAMRDHVLLPPARFAVGDRLRMKLIPMRRAGDEIQSMQRADNLDDLDLRPFFSVETSRQ
ncbi:MAG TPA: hypothetical protein VHW24_19200 [Bryobacteraceae bacterium]|nr:hypothetical protein [Bryobacteraceae bacterium]